MQLLLMAATAATGAALIVLGVGVSLAALGMVDDQLRCQHTGRPGY